MRAYGTTEPLRLLLVEDSEDDAFLLLRELRSGGYELNSRRVERFDELQEALEQDWDIVISDHNLPGFTALDVLASVRDRGRDLPVIVVSGAIGEETAVETMHAGANDYIMKDNLTRLNSAVERELKEAESRRQRAMAESALRQSEEHFRQLAGNIGGVLWLVDLAEGRLIYVNPGFEQLWERPAGPLFDSLDSLLDTVHPEDYEPLATRVAGEGWVGFNGEYRIQLPDGSERWVATRSFPIRDETGHIYRCAGLTSDITERKHFEQEKEKLFRALEQTADMVMITNRDGVIEYVNAAFEDVTGYGREEVVGRRPSLLSSGLQDPGFFERLWKTLSNGLPFTDLFINRRKDGDLYYEAKTITPVRDERGEVTHFVATGKDVTRRLAKQEAIQHLVGHDALTGLGNRLLLVDSLGKCLLKSRRLGEEVAVLCIGIDISGLLGSEQLDQLGEKLVLAAARRLKENLGDAELLARLGQEEFAAVLPGIRGPEEIGVVAERVIAAFAAPVEADGYELYLTLSIGISRYPDDAEDTDALIRQAETAMRHTRVHARTGYGFYRTGMVGTDGRKPLSS